MAKTKVPVSTSKKLGRKANATSFKPGPEWRGNAKGRQPGSRNRLSEQYILDLQAVWAEQGIEALRRAAGEHPVQFARLVGALIPAQWDLGDKTQAGFRSLLEALHAGNFKPRAFHPHEDDGV